MNKTPLEEISPLLNPLLLLLEKDVNLMKQNLYNEEYKLGEILLQDTSIEEIWSQRYIVLNCRANYAYVVFKLGWLNKLLVGSLH